jgi:hypothetical protein
MNRPLSDELLTYASHDIRAIASLFDHFLHIGWLLPSGMHALLEQSARYISIHEGRPPKDPADIFHSGPFLPLDTITEPTHEKRTCHGCSRSLSRRHFDVIKGNRPAFCRVCEAMKVKVKNDAKKSEEKTRKAGAQEARERASQATPPGESGFCEMNTRADQYPASERVSLRDASPSTTEPQAVPSVVATTAPEPQGSGEATALVRVRSNGSTDRSASVSFLRGRALKRATRSRTAAQGS